jgi:hypothetical protein
MTPNDCNTFPNTGLLEATPNITETIILLLDQPISKLNI